MPCVSRKLALGHREGGTEQLETEHKEPHAEALPTVQGTDDGGWNEESQRELKGETQAGLQNSKCAEEQKPGEGARTRSTGRKDGQRSDFRGTRLKIVHCPAHI